MIRLSLLFLLVLIAGFACAPVTPVPEDRFYELRAGTGGNAHRGSKLEGGLYVAHVESDPIRSGRAIIYRHTGKPLELKRYLYDYWVDTPPNMLRASLLQAMQQLSAADDITIHERSRAGYTLRVRIEQFEHVIDNKREYFAIDLKAQLLENRGMITLIEKKYGATAAVESGGRHDVAAAASEALTAIYRELSMDIAALAEKVRRTSG